MEMTKAEVREGVAAVLEAENLQMKKLGRPLHAHEARWVAIATVRKLLRTAHSHALTVRKAERINELIEQSRTMVE